VNFRAAYSSAIMTDKARKHKKRNLVYSHCQHGLKPAVGCGIELKFHPDVEI